MEEKERYIIYRFDGDIFDTKKEYYPSNQTICEIINQQDKQIKELKKENKELEIKIDKCGTELVNAESLVSYLENENQQLKQQIADLEAKLSESEKSKESYRLQNEQHHLQLLQFYSRLGVEAFGADIHEKALETLMIMKEQLAEKDLKIIELEKKLNLNDKGTNV